MTDPQFFTISDIPCPACGASAGQGCEGIPYYHGDRILAYLRRLEEQENEMYTAPADLAQLRWECTLPSRYGVSTDGWSTRQLHDHLVEMAFMEGVLL